MADPTIFSATVTDDAGVTATAIEYVSYDGALTTVDNLIDALIEWAVQIDRISDGKVTQANVILPLSDITGVKASPVNDSTVERTGLFTFNIVGSSYVQSFDVPAIANGIVTNGKIDLANAQVIDWVTSISNPTAPFAAQSKAGQPIGGLRHAVMAFRKRRRARIKASFENT